MRLQCLISSSIHFWVILICYIELELSFFPPLSQLVLRNTPNPKSPWIQTEEDESMPKEFISKVSELTSYAR